MVLKCLYLARIGRPDILWSVNKLARAVTKWIQASDRRLVKWISYIHHTSDYRQCSRVANTRLSIVDWVYFKTQTLLATLRTRNRPRERGGGVLCIFGSRTEVEQLSRSVGCARSKHQYPTVLQSLKSFLWMLDCTNLKDVVIGVLRSTIDTARQSKLAQGNLCRTGDHSINKTKTKAPTERSKREVEQLSNADYVHTNTNPRRSP